MNTQSASNYLVLSLQLCLDSFDDSQPFIASSSFLEKSIQQSWATRKAASNHLNSSQDAVFTFSCEAFESTCDLL